MTKLTSNQIKNAIQDFLTNEHAKNSEKEQKQLQKAIEDKDLEKASELKQSLLKTQEKYSLENWMSLAAGKMAKQISFGTHISKGIHSSSKGDNINFSSTTQLPKTIVGHQSINEHRIDASGNAAALPLYSFFEFKVTEDKKIKDLILEENKEIQLLLSEDSNLSKEYFNAFYQVLAKTIDTPKTSDLNKQILWPTTGQEYMCIVPLHQSSFTNAIYRKIQYLKFSDEMRQRRLNRYHPEEGVVQASYATISDLAIVNLGGSNPQGVSRHTSSQKGVNYLLPSLPPMLDASNDYGKPSKFAKTIFSKALEKKLQPTLDKLFQVIKSNTNNAKIRQLRNQAIDEILRHLLDYAHHLQSNMPAGWSKQFAHLNESEKFWLDPNRANLEGEEAWREKRDTQSWHEDIIHSYARWVNTLLQNQNKDDKGDFADPEHIQWERDMQEMIGIYKRAGKEVFL